MCLCISARIKEVATAVAVAWRVWTMGRQNLKRLSSGASRASASPKTAGSPFRPSKEALRGATVEATPVGDDKVHFHLLDFGLQRWPPEALLCMLNVGCKFLSKSVVLSFCDCSTTMMGGQ